MALSQQDVAVLGGPLSSAFKTLLDEQDWRKKNMRMFAKNGHVSSFLPQRSGAILIALSQPNASNPENKKHTTVLDCVAVVY